MNDVDGLVRGMAYLVDFIKKNEVRNMDKKITFNEEELDEIKAILIGQLKYLSAYSKDSRHSAMEVAALLNCLMDFVKFINNDFK